MSCAKVEEEEKRFKNFCFFFQNFTSVVRRDTITGDPMAHIKQMLSDKANIDEIYNFIHVSHWEV